MGEVDCVRQAIENAKMDNSIEIAGNLLETGNYLWKKFPNALASFR